MTEAEARAALAAFNGLGGLERWTVPGDLQGWRFRVEPAPDGVRVVASANGGDPAVWFVPGQPTGRR